MAPDRPAVRTPAETPATHQQLGCYVENTEYNSVKLCHRFTRAIGSASPPLRVLIDEQGAASQAIHYRRGFADAICGRGDALPGNATSAKSGRCVWSPDAKKSRAGLCRTPPAPPSLPSLRQTDGVDQQKEQRDQRHDGNHVVLRTASLCRIKPGRMWAGRNHHHRTSSFVAA